MQICQSPGLNDKNLLLLPLDHRHYPRASAGVDYLQSQPRHGLGSGSRVA